MKKQNIANKLSNIERPQVVCPTCDGKKRIENDEAWLQDKDTRELWHECPDCIPNKKYKGNKI